LNIHYALLDALGLPEYRFAIEPRDTAWEVKLECAVAGGWEALTLQVDKGLLLASRDDKGARARVVEEWAKRLATGRGSG
jgi:hypothetical protein